MHLANRPFFLLSGLKFGNEDAWEPGRASFEKYNDASQRIGRMKLTIYA